MCTGYILDHFTYSDYDQKCLEIIVLVNNSQRSPLMAISYSGRADTLNNVSKS